MGCEFCGHKFAEVGSNLHVCVLWPQTGFVATNLGIVRLSWVYVSMRMRECVSAFDLLRVMSIEKCGHIFSR